MVMIIGYFVLAANIIIKLKQVGKLMPELKAWYRWSLHRLNYILKPL